jgi:hypothetical protein
MKSFVPNGYGLYDMVDMSGSVTLNPQGSRSPFDPAEPGVHKRVQKSGSFLLFGQVLHPPYDRNTRQQCASTATNHAGFRCVKGAD